MMTPPVNHLLTPLLLTLVGPWYEQPLVWALVLSVLALVLVIPSSSRWQRVAGGVCAAIAGGLFIVTAIFATPQSPAHDWIAIVTFVILAVLTVASAVGMIASRSPVYSAIWFAVTLLSTGGLFLYQGASFLGVATIVVYAGAIVVTFLFVIMLAQPDGHTSYDRISWGWFAKPAAAVAGALILGAVLAALQGFARNDLRSYVALAADRATAADAAFPLHSNQVVSATAQPSLGGTTITLVLRSNAGELTMETKTVLAEELAQVLDAAQETKDAKPLPTPITLHFAEPLLPHQDLQAERHMAHLGGFLFSRHLIAVEVAATLLLVALVGAIAMLSQGPGSISREGREGDAHV